MASVRFRVLESLSSLGGSFTTYAMGRKFLRTFPKFVWQVDPEDKPLDDWLDGRRMRNRVASVRHALLTAEKARSVLWMTGAVMIVLSVSTCAVNAQSMEPPRSYYDPSEVSRIPGVPSDCQPGLYGIPGGVEKIQECERLYGDKYKAAQGGAVQAPAPSYDPRKEAAEQQRKNEEAARISRTQGGQYQDAMKSLTGQGGLSNWSANLTGSWVGSGLGLPWYVILAALILSPFLWLKFAGFLTVRMADKPSIRREAEEWADGVFKLDGDDKSIPEDIRKPYAFWSDWTADFVPMSRAVVLSDVSGSWLLTARNELIFASILFSVVVAGFLIGGPIGAGLNTFALGIFAFYMLGSARPVSVRAAEMSSERMHTGDAPAYDYSGGEIWSRTIRKAHKAQRDNARRDTSELIEIGTGTGMLARRGDVFGGYPEQPFAVSVSDLATHLIVYGMSGSGKTSSVILPLVSQWIEKDCGGMLILDGKAALPGEVAARFGGSGKVLHIAPGTSVTWALLKGLQPIEVVTAILEIAAAGQKEDFWKQSGEVAFRHAAYLAWAGGEWTIDGIRRVLADKRYQDECLSAVPEDIVRNNASVQLAMMYFMKDLPAEVERSPKLAGDIEKTVSGWLNIILAHPDLIAWGRAEEGVDPAECLSGKIVAIDVPASRYGTAGKILSALAKLRVYRAAYDRGDNNWQQRTAVIIDEAQEILTEQDDQIAPVARSLGLCLVYSTQTIEGIVSKLGDDGAQKLLNAARSFVMFQSSPGTYEWAVKKIGLGYAPRPQGFTALGSYGSREESGRLSDSITTEAVARNAAAVSDQQAAKVGEAVSRTASFGASYSAQPAPLVMPGELDTLLAVPFSALSQCLRAGVEKRDIINTLPMHLRG